MFQLGDMGTFIIPIDLSDDYFENPWRELSRIKTSNYSQNVVLVNYLIDAGDDRKLFVDNLSSEESVKYGAEDSEDLFYSTMEDPKLFNKMTKELLVKYQKYTH